MIFCLLINVKFWRCQSVVFYVTEKLFSKWPDTNKSKALLQLSAAIISRIYIPSSRLAHSLLIEILQNDHSPHFVLHLRHFEANKWTLVCHHLKVIDCAAPPKEVWTQLSRRSTSCSDKRQERLSTSVAALWKLWNNSDWKHTTPSAISRCAREQSVPSSAANEMSDNCRMDEWLDLDADLLRRWAEL